MHSTPSTCPACQARCNPQDTICSVCGLVFGSTSATPAPAAPALTPPAVLHHYTALQPGDSLVGGRYTLERALSKGGMGAIYLATDHEAFDRTVVIKAMLDYFDPTNQLEVQEACERFLLEAKTLSTLRHPAIPQIYTYFSNGPHNYIVMEYIEGYDLEQHLSRRDETDGRLIRGKAYEQRTVVEWGIALCRVLEYLSSRQPHPVIHHDIKPANLLIDHNSNAIRLVDFGTARARLLVQGGGVGLHQSSIYGTQGYAAPEQYKGQSEPRSDVYALAATLYHLATDDDPRTHPFDFPQLTRLDTFGDVLKDALNNHVNLRPTATEFRHQLEALQITSGPQPIEAPDGTLIKNVPALVAWCRQNWSQAAAWLYGRLPDQIELRWGQTKLAQTLREAISKHRNSSAGLDAVLVLLDRNDFAQQQPQLTANYGLLDFGRVQKSTYTSHKLTITNTGQRHIHTQIDMPFWLTMPTDLQLEPGRSVTLDLSATIYAGRQSRFNDPIRFSMHGTKLLEVQAKAVASWWRTSPYNITSFLQQTWISWLLLFIFLWFCGGQHWIQQSANSIMYSGRYESARSALERGDYTTAQRELQSLPLGFRDTYTMRWEVSYQQGMAALERQDEAAAREFFIEAGSHRDAHVQVQASYYREGVAAMERQQWNAAREALGSAVPYLNASKLIRQTYTEQARESNAFEGQIEIPREGVQRMLLHPDGETFLTYSNPQTVELWQLETGMLLRTFQIQDAIQTWAISPNGETLAFSDDRGLIRLWNLKDDQLLKLLEGHTDGVSQLQFSANGTELLSIGPNAAIKKWDINTSTLLATAPARDLKVLHASFSSAVDTVLFVGDQGNMYLYGIDQQLTELGTFSYRNNTTAFSPDGKRAAFSVDNTVHIVYLDDDAIWQPLPLDNTFDTISHLAFSPDGEYLLIGTPVTDTAPTDATLMVLRLRDQTITQTLPAHHGGMISATFTPDGKRIVSSDRHTGVWVWKVDP